MSARARLAREAGFTLIEVLVAWSVLLVALVGTLHAFAGAQSGTARAEQRASMIVIAQRELERLRAVPYARLGLSALPAVRVEAPRTGPSASETLVDGGVVEPGPTPFRAEGVSGRIYRYVTWRPQSCPLLSAKVGTEIEQQAAVASGSASAAIGDLCPGAQSTKRVVVAVAADDPGNPGRQPVPVRAHTIVSDTAAGVLPNPAALAVDRSGATADAPRSTADELYAGSSTQTLYLHDTPCSATARQPRTSGHETRDSARRSHHCGSSEGRVPDLMSETAPPGSEPATDHSSDLVRSPVNGLALKRDDRGGDCAAEIPYQPEDSATRRWSVHQWSTRPLTASARTLDAGGRATLTLWTHTVGAVAGSGRLCVVVRRPATNENLGVADFRLAQWPTSPTQLAVSFDLAAATIPAGERLTVILRNHPDSAHDLELLYDRADAPASLDLTMAAGQELR